MKYRALDRRIPGLKEKVEVTDVATPMTYVRYTGNWRGSYEGFAITRNTVRYIGSGLKRELPGLEDFYMIGQWLAREAACPPRHSTVGR